MKKVGKGAVDLARKVVELAKKENNFKYIYNLEDTIITKIEKVSKEIYGASEIEISKEVEGKIRQMENLGYGELPICIAKTQYSLSDDARNLECNNDFKIHVKDVILKAGAGFIVIITGKIMTMPGLPKVPAAEKIDINESGDIIGIF